MLRCYCCFGVFFSASLLQEIDGANRDLLTPSCYKALTNVRQRVAAALKKKGSAQLSADADRLKKMESANFQRAQSTVPATADPALLKSDSVTLADAILSQARAKLPPPKAGAPGPEGRDAEGPAANLGKKALIARSIAKRYPVAKTDLLKLAPRPKLSQRRLAQPQPG